MVFAMAKQQSLFSPKFGATSSHVFTQSPAKLRSKTRNSQFGLMGQFVCATTNAVGMAAPLPNILDTTSLIGYSPMPENRFQVFFAYLYKKFQSKFRRI
jgi:hypothetical protein